MAKNPRQRILGICLDEASVRLTEVEKILGRYKVNHVSEAALANPFSLATVQNADLLLETAETIRSVLLQREIDAEYACVALNSKYAIVKRVPYDSTLSAHELEAHAAWELEQYIISPVEEYSFDLQTYSIPSDTKYTYLLIAGVRKLVLDALETIAQHLSIPLGSVTVDVLAHINALEHNYDFEAGDKAAIVEIGSAGVEFILSENFNFVGNRAISFRELGLRDDIALIDPESLANHISKQVRFLTADFWGDEVSSGLDHVLLSRSSSAIPLDSVIEASKQLPMQIIQPFRKIGLSDKLQRSLDRGTIFAEFMSAIGATIRED